MADGAQHICSSTAFEPFPRAALDGSIVDRFAEQVMRHPHCVAVVDRGRSLTYGELDEWANGIAHVLVDRIEAHGEPVALVVAQGAGYAAAVLGTLKSGCPYVPLEPADPPARLRDLVTQCGARLVVADAAVPDLPADRAVIRLHDVTPRSTGPGVQVGPDDLAYVFFTSGSTGVPKGVFDSHRNVLHNVLRYTNALELRPTDRLTLLQGPAFSGCVSSQFGALLNGAASFPFRLGEEGLVAAAEWLRNERITIYHSVPSVFRSLVAHGRGFPAVRVVRLEGDRATSEDADLWRRHFAETSVLANGLGTTETGLARQLIVRHGDVVEEGALPVGSPVADVSVVVVDDDGAAVGEGESGEIVVTGPYLALGYWRRPDLTAERFEVRDGLRAYRTGDLGRIRPDGCLEYLGRKAGDQKVLGTRIEPAEVERELLRLDGVRDAAVAIHSGRRGDGRVVAYVVSGDGNVHLQSLREALSERLPHAMLPTALVEVAELPLGQNGKVDRRALPAPPVDDVSSSARASPDEQWLAQIWAEVLERETVGPQDDFFALGGDSLAAAEVVARIEVATGRALPLATLVRAPTVAALGAVLSGTQAHGASSLTVLREGERPPLILVHGNTGNALHYSRLVEHLNDRRALWALEHVATDDLRVETIAAGHVATLLREQPDGPYRLLGFCYGAVVARQIAVDLTAQGREVELLALLALTPLEFPTLLAVGADTRWSDVLGPSSSFRTQVRHHLRRASALSRGAAARYVARRAANLVARPVRRRRNPPSEAYRAVVAHRPPPYTGHALVVLHALDAAEYTDAPERDWDALAESLEVVVLPGAGHDMLEEPGVETLATLLRAV